jgi:hypothetical protein
MKIWIYWLEKTEQFTGPNKVLLVLVQTGAHCEDYARTYSEPLLCQTHYKVTNKDNNITIYVSTGSSIRIRYDNVGQLS